MDNLVFGHNNVISESLSILGDYAWPNFLSGYRELLLTSYLSKFVYVLLSQISFVDMLHANVKQGKLELSFNCHASVTKIAATNIC